MGTHDNDTTVGWYRSEQHAVRLALSSDGSEIQQVDNLHRRGNRNLCS
jgi:4-alpha-glucanotransferase